MKRLIIRSAQYFDGRYLIPKLIKVEEDAWKSNSEELTASSLKIIKRIEIFPQGVSIALIEEDLSIESVGSQYAFRFDWDGDLSKLTSWDELTSNGYIENVHFSSGNTGFLVGVGVVHKFRGEKFEHNLSLEKQYKASELLIAFTLETLFNEGVNQVVGNARIPFYHKMPHMELNEYCNFRTEDGRLFDPVLRFHERMGAKVIKPVTFSMDDPESLNAGAWVLYTRKFKD